jgi:succinyl-CoA synthetase beta subunit
MKIHEYQAKQILARYGVVVPRGEVVSCIEEARGVAERLGEGTVVVKAQIHAGGRGKGGGVKLARNREEAEKAVRDILGMTLVTHQTGPEGRVVHKVLIEEGLAVRRELYLGLVVDRAQARPVFMASTEGGVEIEVVAAEHPEKILRESIDPSVGFQAFQARRLAFGLDLDGAQVNEAVRLFTGLYRAFEGTDASLAEINQIIFPTWSWP